VTNAFAALPLRYLATLDDLIAYAEAEHWDLCAIEIDARAVPLPAFEWPARPLVVIGNEGRGIPERLLARSRIARIPQYGHVECLNAATSAAVALYDFLAQRASLPERRIDGGKFR
jgi:tRNA G18 (ribose-2'-O)-methylase SpoU